VQGDLTAAQAASPPQKHLGTFRIGLLSLYWVALGYLWLPLGSQVLPGVLLNIVGDAHKGPWKASGRLSPSSGNQ
jgi:hypothetical protein